MEFVFVKFRNKEFSSAAILAHLNLSPLISLNIYLLGQMPPSKVACFVAPIVCLSVFS